MPRTLILGIGNSILSDEGVGIHLVRHLSEILPPGDDELQFLDGGTLSFTLAGDIAGADHLIVVDAAQLSETPGTVQTFIGADMDAFIGTGKLSVHEVGLVDLLDIARLTDSLPALRALVAIQPSKIDWGCELSRQVVDAIPLATAAVRCLLDSWRTESTVRPVFDAHQGI